MTEHENNLSGRKRKPNRARVRSQADHGGPWSAVVALAAIPAAGRHLELKPDETVRQAVADAVGVLALPRLEASFDLAPLAGDGLRVSGRVSASVEQNCVLTLEPMRSEIEEPVDLVLVQAGAMPPPRAALDIDVSEEAGTPDVLQGHEVDLGAIATEFLTLGIDPYPRKQGAEFQAPAAPDEPEAHPFAVLAALKTDSGPKSG
jgi:uncharacterized metal-binding protein YceD (DUF177 family)